MSGVSDSEEIFDFAEETGIYFLEFQPLNGAVVAFYFAVNKQKVALEDGSLPRTLVDGGLGSGDAPNDDVVLEFKIGGTYGLADEWAVGLNEGELGFAQRAHLAGSDAVLF